MCLLIKGYWSAYASHPQRLAKVRANKISYAWDRLIEEFSYHIMTGTQRSATSRVVGEQEVLLRWLARESRIRRRMLSSALLGIMDDLKQSQKSSSRDHRACRIVAPSGERDPYFVFLAMSHRHARSESQYREARVFLLEAYCRVLKLRFPDAQDVIGIATESGFEGENRSEDALYINLREWNSEMEEDAKRLQREINLLNHITISRGSEQEYPRPAREQRSIEGAKTTSRNAKCPCGSRRRYRKCCGKQFHGRFKRRSDGR